MIFPVFREVKSSWEKYIDEEGLKNAVSKLKEFKDKNQRVPRVRENSLGGIEGAIYRREWKSDGINNWNDLLLYIFEEKKKSKYIS